MLDLPALGRELRSTRRGLRIPSAELARRIGVSQTYVWLIEQAKPRTSGEPSRPKEELLRRWTTALGMSADDAQRIRELAGYFGPDLSRERGGMLAASPPSSPRAMSSAQDAMSVGEAEHDRAQRGRSERDRRGTNSAALQRWAGTAQSDDADAAIVRRIQDLLERADRLGATDETRGLLNSFLSWLDFHMSEET